MPIKLPSSVLEARGSFKKDPKRKRVDPVVTGDLGEAPAYFHEDERAIWDELKGIIPVGLAKSADRWMVEIAARYMAKFRDTGLKSTELAQLLSALGKLGMSPADRAKCAMPPTPDPKGNEFSDF
jgi:hypothetical protein